MEVPPNRVSRLAPLAWTDVKLFAGRCHWIIAQEGWEEVAGYIADWLHQVPGARV